MEEEEEEKEGITGSEHAGKRQRKAPSRLELDFRPDRTFGQPDLFSLHQPRAVNGAVLKSLSSYDPRSYERSPYNCQCWRNAVPDGVIIESGAEDCLQTAVNETLQCLQSLACSPVKVSFHGPISRNIEQDSIPSFYALPEAVGDVSVDMPLRRETLLCSGNFPIKVKFLNGQRQRSGFVFSLEQYDHGTYRVCSASTQGIIISYLPGCALSLVGISSSDTLDIMRIEARLREKGLLPQTNIDFLLKRALL